MQQRHITHHFRRAGGSMANSSSPQRHVWRRHRGIAHRTSHAETPLVRACRPNRKIYWRGVFGLSETSSEGNRRTTGRFDHKEKTQDKDNEWRHSFEIPLQGVGLCDCVRGKVRAFAGGCFAHRAPIVMSYRTLQVSFVSGIMTSQTRQDTRAVSHDVIKWPFFLPCHHIRMESKFLRLKTSR